MILNEESLGFRLLVGQKEQFEDVALVNGDGEFFHFKKNVL